MRSRAYAAASAVIAFFSACQDDPTSPREARSSEGSLPPRAAVFADPSDGTIPFVPLPGAGDVTIVGGNGGYYVGSSGGRPALWEALIGAGQPEMVVTDLTPLDEASDADFYGFDVQVAGSMNGRAARWRGGTVTDLGALPGHDRSTATATQFDNSVTYVVGESWSTGREAEGRAFIWDGTTMSELPPLPGHVRSRATSVHTVGGGTVAGLSFPAGGGSGEIVVWSNRTPVATGFDDGTYLAHGITAHFTTPLMRISARAGNAVMEWRDGSVTALPHPHQADPSGEYWLHGVSTNPSILYELEVSEPLVSRRFGVPNGDWFEALSVLPLDDCILEAVCTSPMRPYPMVVIGSGRSFAGVQDLTVTQNGTSSVTLMWTQIDDGTGQPARYRVKYAEARFRNREWSDATRGCDVVGDEIGGPASCTVTGLDPDTPYEFVLMSYRVENGTWADAAYSNLAVGQTGWSGGGGPPPGSGPGMVSDLSVLGTTSSTATLEWTQVDDGTGDPAWYRVKYAEPPMNWRAATIGCERTLVGSSIGAPMSCTVEGLDPSTAYEFQLMSYRVEDGAWVDAQYSNVTSSTTGSGSSAGSAGVVSDLGVTQVTSSSVTVSWTQTDDGTGNPSWYRVKFAEPPIEYPSATPACTIRGQEIGAPLTCTLAGLDSGTTYDIQLMSYRMVDGVWVGAVGSNVATATTD